MLTDRLELVPATVALCDAEALGPSAVADALGSDIPTSWPPPVFEPDDVARVRQQLIADAGSASWTLHYVLRRQTVSAKRPILVGVAGYGGPPDTDGLVEIGYAILSDHQCRGYATEAVGALVSHAFADASIRGVVATTYHTLQASIRVLEKAGFAEVSRDQQTGLMRFERRREGIA